MKNYLLHLLVVLALSLGVSAPVVADKGDGAFKLEGAWVARAQAPGMGQWSYVVSSDPSGKQGSGHGTVDVGFRANFVCGMNGYSTAFETSDTRSPILVSMVMTGRDTVAYNAIWYGLKDFPPEVPLSNEIVLIGVVTGDLDVVAPEVMEGTHNFELYYPSADADGDGFPDDGVEPVCEFSLNTVDKRLPMPE
jgi:hypothetical protein